MSDNKKFDLTDYTNYAARVVSSNSATSPAMNAASPRHVPDSECAQRKCACTTTGCWDECNLKRNPVVFAMNAASPTDIHAERLGSFAQEAHVKTYLYVLDLAKSRGYESVAKAIRAAPVGQGSATSGDVGKVGLDLDGVPQPYAGAVVLLETIAEVGALAFHEDGRATENRELCLRFSADLRAALAASAEQPPSGIDLSPVIQWLEGGCDPKLAAQELRLVQAKIEEVGGGQSNSAGSAREGGNTKPSIAEWDSMPYAKHGAISAPVAERAAAPASVPEGYKLVPIVPTKEQWQAGIDAWNDAHGTPAGEDELPNTIYHAMTFFAPEVALPAAQGDSIDTPAWRKLFELLDSVIPGVNDEEQIMQRIIDHVHEWGASQRQEGRRDADLEARNKVAAALLGVPSNCVLEGKSVSFAWAYLLAVVKDLATPASTAGEPSAEAIGAMWDAANVEDTDANRPPVYEVFARKLIKSTQGGSD